MSLALVEGLHPILYRLVSVLSCVKLPMYIHRTYLAYYPQRPTPSRSDQSAITYVSYTQSPCVGKLLIKANYRTPDKTPSRKGPLVASLAGAIIGTTIVAPARSRMLELLDTLIDLKLIYTYYLIIVPVLLIGRIIQATTGNAVFIIGFAAVASTVQPKDRPKTLQIITVVSMSGMLVGINNPLRLLAYLDSRNSLFNGDNATGDARKSDQKQDEETSSGIESSEETTRLLSEPVPDQDQRGYNSKYEDDQVSSESSMGDETKGSFYKVMLRNPHALTAMLCHGVNGLTLMSFDTTLPLYVMRNFQWDTQKISLMFLLLQLPTYGTKITASVGFYINAVLIWFIGNCGPDGLPFVDSGKISRELYAASMFFIGVLRALVVGCGVVELTSEIITRRTCPILINANRLMPTGIVAKLQED
ncbi:MFS transporter [Penicillium angulare]|uniref:MFS transporter n=1 Tax=Penicillium angulare TaxID=116970 RepID=UPI002540AF59|nr:MFS transporter [Penicillium angulare]KAJ5291783.1 MFS transporter [Penicillium angulare]